MKYKSKSFDEFNKLSLWSSTKFEDYDPVMYVPVKIVDWYFEIDTQSVDNTGVDVKFKWLCDDQFKNPEMPEDEFYHIEETDIILESEIPDDFKYDRKNNIYRK